MEKAEKHLPRNSIARILCSWYPFFSGQGRLAGSGILAMLIPYAGVHLFRLKGQNEWIFLDTSDHLHRIIAFFGYQDRQINKLMTMMLSPRDVFVDVGANCGSLSIRAASLVGPKGRIVAYEPNPKQAELFRMSCERNSFENIDLHQIALSDRDEAGALVVPTMSSGYASLSSDGEAVDSDTTVSVEVEIQNTSRAFSEAELTDVKLLKVDVEGHEPEFFRGAQEYFEKNSPRFVLLEVSGDALFWDRSEVQFLTSFGYIFYAIPHSIFDRDPTRLDPSQREIDVDFRDVIATLSDTPWAETR